MEFDRLMLASFEKCIFSVNAEKAIKRLPSVLSSQEVATHLDGYLDKMLGRGRMLDVAKDVQEDEVHVAKSRQIGHTAPQTRSMRIQARSQRC